MSDSFPISRQPYIPLLLVHVQEERSKLYTRTIYPSSFLPPAQPSTFEIKNRTGKRETEKGRKGKEKKNEKKSVKNERKIFAAVPYARFKKKKFRERHLLIKLEFVRYYQVSKTTGRESYLNCFLLVGMSSSSAVLEKGH